MIFKKTC